MKKGANLKQKSIAFIVAAGLFIQIGFLAAPKQAHANMPVVDSGNAAIETVENVLSKVWKGITKAMMVAGSTAMVNTMSYMANSLAYNAAQKVVHGNEAGPLYEARPVMDYVNYVGMQVVASAINDLAGEEIYDEMGVCSPSATFSLRLGLQSLYQKPELESCDFRDLWDSDSFLASMWETISDDDKRNEAILSAVQEGLNPGVTELSASTTVYSNILGKAIIEKRWKTMEMFQSNGFKGVNDFLTGRVETPASLIEHEFEYWNDAMNDSPGLMGAAILSNGELMADVGAQTATMAAQVFTSTLLSEYMNKFYEKGFFEDVDVGFTDPFSDISQSYATSDDIDQSLRSLRSFKPISIGDYSLITDFTTCPTNVSTVNKGLYNCVLDTSFASALAIAETGDPITVQDAIDQNYINGDWALISSDSIAQNQDDRCFEYAFCHSNLTKLRKARIIPVGWEMAAEEAANTTGLTLQDAIDAFYTCNEDGERDANHPYCHLVDPNWILKVPDAQCKTMAYGQSLLSSESSARQEECVDVRGCIAEDENGTCLGGYSYCVREKNTWRFQGESCPSYYASCQTFEDVKGNDVSYNKNTLDMGDCSEGSVGCEWLQTVKEEGSESFDWKDITNVAEETATPSVFNERIYLTSAAEDCSEDGAGCVELIERTEDLYLNMVPNPSFETDDDENGYPDAWLSTDWDAMTVSSSSTSDALNGDVAINTGSGVLYQYGLKLWQQRFYTFSFYAAQGTEGGTESIESVLFLGDASEQESVDLAGTSYTGDCVVTDYDSDGNDDIIITAQPASTDFERFQCTFTAPTFADATSTVVYALDFFNADIWVDSIMIEQAGDASVFTHGYSEEASATYAKLPPEYLGCTGQDDDPAECENYAPICSASNVGCLEYTPANGDPAVFGVVNSLGICPSECVGYETYKQEATLYEPNGEFPVYFIADSADECSEQAVGCDEFTNLSTEEASYFTYLRACQTEESAAENTGGDQSAVFYTWEGSDNEGYQLKTWDLLESNLDYVANYRYADSGEFNRSPGSAPCTQWYADEDGIHCDDDADADRALDTDSADCDEHDDIFSNPDCREFYDAEGAIHYREWSKTVTISDACTSFRKTDLVGLGSDDDADGTDDGQENCEDSGAYFHGDLNACIYYGLESESDTCSDSENGCREYTGNRSGNSRLVLQDLFESDTLGNWEADNASNVTLSNDSIATGGHSLRSDGEVITSFLGDNGSECTDEDGCTLEGTIGGSCTVGEGGQYCGTLEGNLFTGKTYTLSFWAKGSGVVGIGFDLDAGAIPEVEIDFDQGLELEGEWNEYALGPLNITESSYPTFGEQTTLVFKPRAGSTLYLDNIVLREGEQNITVIKDSWVTPATCDENIEGQSSAQYHLGCAEYYSSEGDTTYISSFASLCSESEVGCKDYFVTNQSESPHANIYSGSCGNLDADGDEESDIATEKTACYLNVATGWASYDEDSPYLCSIPTGETACEFDLDFYIPQGYLFSAGNDPYVSSLQHIAYNPNSVFIEGDHIVNAIIDEHECSSDNMGCQELGEPQLSADGTVVEAWESVYRLNLPDNYDETLCNEDVLWCSVYDAGEDGTFYFRDPVGKECEYKSDVSIGGAIYSGWFREGTTDFCYGAGVCSGDEDATCSLDSDCADHTDGNLGTCSITSGEYLIDGELSGIWKNGDEDFAGWYGLCDNDYNQCTAFEDVLDIDDDEFYASVDGEIHYYIDDESIGSATTLSGSQDCDGQVGSKEGCVLFQDSNSTSSAYNASATYILSAHADDFYGQKPDSLVDPIDCEATVTSIENASGDDVDLCAQRCGYRNSQLYSVTHDDEAVEDVYGDWTFGGSCYEDADCPSFISESGDDVEGSCKTTAKWNEAGGSTYTTEDVPVLENDTNRIFQVTRDRVCSEWYDQAGSYTVWDEETASYREIVDSIDLCKKYSEETGRCADWETGTTPVVFDIEDYASRDVSWYGEEFTGYAIPDIYPLQHLEQVDINPAKICAKTYYNNGTQRVCDEDSDCSGTYTDDSGTTVDNECITNPEQDFRLAFDAGTCSETGQGGDCTIGYCRDTGKACSRSTDCGDSKCVTGTCYAVNVSSGSESSCSTDDNCSGDDMCYQGVCVAEDTGVCDVNFACSSDFESGLSSSYEAKCYTSEAAKEGSCLRGSCLLALDGSKFDDEKHEAKVCRAHPEEDSPFSADLVSEWVDPYDVTEDPGSTADDITWEPYKTIAGYENANFCAPGENCECNYDKLQEGGGGSKYVSISSTDYSSNDDWDGLEQGRVGLCSESTSAGALCITGDAAASSDEECYEYSGDGEELCNALERVDTLIGMEGYCIERDTGNNINGDPDQGACLSWFPVDQLSGSTDLTAKYSEAGYVGEDAFYCAEVHTYADVKSFKGCAEYATNCWENVSCPSGFFAVVGEAADAAEASGDVAGYCDITSGTSEGWPASGTADACPYMCVPYNSFRLDDDGETQECSDQVDVIGDFFWGALAAHGTAGSSDYDGTTTFYTAHGAFADDAFDFFGSCTAYGVSIEENELGLWDFDIAGSNSSCSLQRSYNVAEMADTYRGQGLNGLSMYAIGDQIVGDVTPLDDSAHNHCANYATQFPEIKIYPGCTSVIQVADADSNDSSPRTDLIMRTGSTETIAHRFNYTYDEENEPFGATDNPSNISNLNNYLGVLDPTPIIVPHCEGETSETIVEYEYGLLSGECSGGEETAEIGQGKSFLDWVYGYWHQAEMTVSNGDGMSDIVGRIDDAFAHSMNLFSWHKGDDSAFGVGNAAQGEYSGQTVDSTDGEYWDQRSSGAPPRVWAIDTENCYGTYCQEGAADTISVNHQDSGDIATTGSLPASIKFYAAADKDQLPIRRVIVDWGDDHTSGSAASDNYYQNHRGLVYGSETISHCDACDSGDTAEDCEWGKTVDSCDPNYFNYSHTYSCDNPRALPSCSVNDYGHIVNSPCSYDGESCTYQPRVHVRDQWGWCAGTCSEDTDGCFDSDGSLDSENPERDLCAYSSHPSSSTSSADPWVYYDGSITIAPAD